MAQAPDSDYGSEFINWHSKAWCEERQIQLTRGRPYKKDDNAHVEQKNWTHVRKLLDWERYDSLRAVEAMNDLDRHELRWWLNLFLPSVNLRKKIRVGSKLRRVYGPPQTLWERVLTCAQADPDRVAELKRLSHIPGGDDAPVTFLNGSTDRAANTAERRAQIILLHVQISRNVCSGLSFFDAEG